MTLIFSWIYVQRANLEYNAEGRFFSAEEEVVYHEQTKEVYGILALSGLMLTVLLMATLMLRRKIHTPNRT